MASFRVALIPVALACVTAIPAAGAQPFEILHAFENPPAVPWGGLVLGPDGLVYGTTEHGGRYDLGTVFRFDPVSGVVTVLHHFKGTDDGIHPRAGLVWGGDALYGTTAGTAGTWSSSTVKGTVFKITTAGTLLTLHSFSGADGMWPLGVLVPVEDVLWGTTEAGGTFGYGTVFKVGRSGGLTTVHSFPYGTEGFFPMSGLALGPDRTLFGTTHDGGSGYRGTLFKIDPEGGFTKLHDFTATEGSPIGEPFVDASGAVIGTTLMGDLSSGGTVYRHLPGGTHQVLSNFPAYSLPSGGLVQGPNGLLYGLTSGYNLTYGWGSLYSVDPVTSGLRTLYYFGKANPQGRLLVVGNELLGTTSGYDSDPDRGTIFRYSTGESTLATLHEFGTTEGGCTPVGLAVGAGAALYGTTEYCGAAGGGTVFELTSAGARTAYTFPYSPQWVEGRESPTGRTGMTVSRVTWAGPDLLYGVRRSETLAYRNYGSVFQLTPSTGEHEILHEFVVREEGSAPEYAPMVTSDGRLWGTTSEGGATYRGGVLYGMGVDGRGYDVSHHFANDAGGQGPSSPLLEATDGSFYGTTAFAPVTIDWNSYPGCGGMFRGSQETGALTGIYTFPWSPANYPSGCQPRGSLAEGPGGRIYGVTTYGMGTGGGWGYGVVYELDPTVTPWNPRIIHAFGTGADGSYPHDLVYSPDGFLYGAALKGSHDKGVVYRLRPDGTGYEVVHDFDGDDGTEPAGLVIGSDRQLYGITRMGGPGGGGVVFRIALAPTAGIAVPDTVAEGDTVTLTASGVDPAGGPLSYDWDLDDDREFDDFSGSTAEFVAGPDRDGPGTYPVAVRVTTAAGVSTDASSEVTVTNVAPVVEIQPSAATVDVGVTVSLRVTFDDPGPDTWTASIAFGDGATETRPLATLGDFGITHVYALPSDYTVRVTVADDDGDTGTAQATVTVRTAAQSIGFLIEEIEDLLDDGTLKPGQGKSLINKLEQALATLQAGDTKKAITMLEAFIHEVRAFKNAGILEPAQADEWIAIAVAVIVSISG